MMPCNIIAGAFATFRKHKHSMVLPFCTNVFFLIYKISFLLNFLVSLCQNPDLGALSGVDSVYILLMGIGVLGAGFYLLTLAPMYIPAPEVSLYTLIETVVGPIWVWLGGYEAPSVFAVAGGCILIVALAIHRLVSHLIYQMQ